MSQHPHRTLWRRDFDVVPAAERRLARFALQALDSSPSTRRAMNDESGVGVMWQLILPLLEPDAVARALPPPNHPAPPDGDTDESGWCAWHLGCQLAGELTHDILECEEPTLDSRQKYWIRGFLKTLPRWVMTRLAKADGRAPISSTVALLGEVLGLD
ncbi:MAG: AAA family ATPase, partial [Sphingobacteriia bacterium]|nr:AAA family ATPase [Sphingobacteriia bacterium]